MTYGAIVSIERPSVTISNQYMTMRAIDIAEYTAKIDTELFPLIGEKKKN